MKNKGISLIVLVITIIVMIILAAAIIISLNNTGIISNANMAQTKTDDKQIREAIEVAKLNLNFEGNLNKDTLQNELQKSLGVDVEVIDNMDKSYTIKVKDMYYTLEEDETVVSGIYDMWDKTSTEPTQKTTNEIHIYKASELKWIQEEVEKGNTFEGYKIYLENNLDFGARENSGTTLDEKWKTAANKENKWIPIGKEKEKALKAEFDGKNHTIKGIYVEETTKYNGIFGCSSNTVCNLTIKNSYIEGAGYIGAIGGAIQDINAKVYNCHNINTTVILIDADYSINHMIGGIVGTCKNVSNCTNTGNIIAYGMDDTGAVSQIGGIAGVVNGEKIDNCINYGKIISNGALAGGIVGKTAKTVENCTNYGEVISNGMDSDNRSLCGGIAGAMTNTGYITNCANYANVTGVAGYVGGITGLTAVSTEEDTSTNKIEYCFNAGNVKGTNHVGGIAGCSGNFEEEIVKYCYSKGIVSGNTYVGSIIGYRHSNKATCEYLYYLNTLNLKAINNTDYEDKNVKSTTNNIKSFEEFKTWISQFK